VGVQELAGSHLEADAEGLAIYYGPRSHEGYLIASSQGDDTFHVFARTGGFTRRRGNTHLAEFTVDGASETDGHDVVNVPVGRAFPKGLFVLQNGGAEEPENSDDINGYGYDGSSQFLYLGWDDIATPLGLSIATRGYDPRR